MAHENFDPIAYVIKSFNKHSSIFQKNSCNEVKRLLVISTLKSLAKKKIFSLRSLN